MGMAARVLGLLRLITWLVVIAALLAGAGYGAWKLVVERGLPEIESLADYNRDVKLTTTVFARDGRVIGELHTERRRLVALADQPPECGPAGAEAARSAPAEAEGEPPDEIPRCVVLAFLAAEDAGFWKHQGVDPIAMLRAALAVALAGGEKVQGASTITMQTVKQFLISREKSYIRKLKEIVLATRIEKKFSKREILYIYLNHIYFGRADYGVGGIYGVGEAARIYFGKERVADLALSEAALLAGLPQRPNYYSPFRNPEAAEARRRLVLRRMREENFIKTDEQLEAALAARPVLQSHAERRAFAADQAVARYFTEEVRRRLAERLGEDERVCGRTRIGDAGREGPNECVQQAGLKVWTTLDLDSQHAAVAALRGGVEAVGRRRGYRGALRNIQTDHFQDEIAKLAERNGFPLREEQRYAALNAADKRSFLDERGFFDATREGLVVMVDEPQQRARVSFAPGVVADVQLADADWAHPADPDSPRPPGRPVQNISEIFALGDVAAFRLAQEENGLRASLAQTPDLQGALLSFDLARGDVLALVGGYDFSASEFNRATQALRQPGSAFKPLVYAAAVSAGYTPSTIIHDRPFVRVDEASGEPYRPENYGRRFLGALPMTVALARSVNNATIHLLDQIGISRTIAFARRLGVRSPLKKKMGLALGASSMTLLEITRAYAVLGAGGRYLEPRLLSCVEDRNGQRLIGDVPLDPALPAGTRAGPQANSQANPPGGCGPVALLEDPAAYPEQEEQAGPLPGVGEGAPPDPGAPLPEGFVMRPADAYVAVSMLRQVVEHPRGTGGRARALRRPVAGKTGTTNDNTDAWFVGFSPQVATGVWVGIDDNRMGLGPNETGSRAAAPIWIEYMRQVLKQHRPSEFAAPRGVVLVKIDPQSGLLAAPESEGALKLAFVAGSEPTESAEAAAEAKELSRKLNLEF